MDEESGIHESFHLLASKSSVISLLAFVDKCTIPVYRIDNTKIWSSNYHTFVI